MKYKSLLFSTFTLAFFPFGLHAQNDTPEAAVEEAAPLEEVEKIVLTAEQQKAVDGYKAEMLAIQGWLTEYRDSAHGHEARAHRIPLLIAEKLAGVKMDGLPTQITEPFTAVRKSFDANAAMLKDMPKEDAAVMVWIADKLADEKWAAQSAAYNEEQNDLIYKLAYSAETCDAGKESDLFQLTELSQMVDTWVVILGSYKKFEEAEAEAKKVSEKSKIPYSRRGMIFDEKGLRLPDDFEDELYAGQYVLRISNELFEGEKEYQNHISVEMSDSYEGFEPGFYIIVGNIALSEADADAMQGEFKKHVPSTYAKTTEIFMGCDR